jgi:hypothetical protein
MRNKKKLLIEQLDQKLANFKDTARSWSLKKDG